MIGFCDAGEWYSERLNFYVSVGTNQSSNGKKSPVVPIGTRGQVNMNLLQEAHHRGWVT